MTTTASATDLTKTHNCKTPNCVNEARSSVGRYSYCDDCRERRARSRPGAAGQAAVAKKTAGSFIERLDKLKVLAKKVDRERERARRLTEEALKVKRAADELEAELRAAVREISTDTRNQGAP